MASPRLALVLAAALALLACNEVDRTRWIARLGSADAQRALGERYASGEGIERNLDEAFVWLEKAAEHGSVAAQMRLVALYGERGGPDDAARAERWLRAAAEAGDAHGQVRLAEQILAKGGDEAEAAKWIASAAEKGDPHAQLLQARRLARQPGREAEAVPLLTRAAEQGDADSAWELARLGTAGSAGIDAAATLKWLTQAAEAGQPAAEHELGNRYASGKGVAQDLAQARVWYERSANQGMGPAQKRSASSIRPAVAPTRTRSRPRNGSASPPTRRCPRR
jgi:uncharacterized protein